MGFFKYQLHMFWFRNKQILFFFYYALLSKDRLNRGFYIHECSCIIDVIKRVGKKIEKIKRGISIILWLFCKEFYKFNNVGTQILLLKSAIMNIFREKKSF